MTTCDIIAERTALGEALDEYASHAVTCKRCRELVATAGDLGATHSTIDPGLGFAARMTVGAQNRIAVRRRRRIATTVGVTAAAAVAMVFIVTRPTDPKPAPEVAINPVKDTVKDEPPVVADEADLRFLLTDTTTAARAGADWKTTTKPLRPYKKLLQGIR